MNKKIISLTAILLCFLSISLTSCDGEDEGGDYVSPNYVAATWSLTAVGGLNANSVLVYTPIASGPCDAPSVTLTEDMMMTRNSSILAGNICTPIVETGTYALDQGNIVATYVPNGATENVTITYDIIVLSDVTLELAYTDSTTNQLVFLKFSKVVPVAN